MLKQKISSLLLIVSSIPLLWISVAPLGFAQPEGNVKAMSQQELQSSLFQAALTVCFLRGNDIDFKLALSAATIPVVQVLRNRYDGKVEGFESTFSDNAWIKYFGVKISEISLSYCSKMIPSNVSEQLSNLKDLKK